MRLLQDGIVAMLAAIGLATVLWLVVSIFLRTKKQVFSHVTAVVTARGRGDSLEHTVHTLAQLRHDQGAIGSILVVDYGLDQEGRELARLLSREEEWVALCRPEDLADYFQ